MLPFLSLSGFCLKHLPMDTAHATFPNNLPKHSYKALRQNTPPNTPPKHSAQHSTQTRSPNSRPSRPNTRPNSRPNTPAQTRTITFPTKSLGRSVWAAVWAECSGGCLGRVFGVVPLGHLASAISGNKSLSKLWLPCLKHPGHLPCLGRALLQASNPKFPHLVGLLAISSPGSESSGLSR